MAVPYSMESSSLDRVNVRVNSLGDDDEDRLCPQMRLSNHLERTLPKLFGALKKRFCRQTISFNPSILCPLSSVAHISGMGLKVVPAISAFSSIRSVNLSSNLIVQIHAGSLPMSLHTLDLSRNTMF